MNKKAITSIIFMFLGCTYFPLNAQVATYATYDVIPANGNGIRFWSGDTYKIHMGNSSEYKYGSVTDYSIKANMNNDPARGWTWGVSGATPVASINTQGHLQIAGNFIVGGNIVLPSLGGNKQIYTWNAGDANWRIGMSPAPGFTRSLATSHVEYLTYGNGVGQGFAVGVNGGESGFEIHGNDHKAFFRGNVGIGAVNASAKLEVVSNTVNGGDNTLKLSAPAIGPNASHVHYGTAGDWYIRSAQATGKVVIQDYNGGKVGVGTDLPQARLHISNGDVLLQNATSGYPSLWLKDASGANTLKFDYNSIIHSGGVLHIRSGATNHLLLNDAGGGNVGIGTSAPNEKLTVNGTIYGKEVKVDLNVPGPDYVFEKDYNLPSLGEIKSYIEQHKHLPEVPSAKEMEADGINIGEMNMILLKKIEELTLYLIELKQRNENSDQRIEKLEAEINTLRK